MAVVNLLHIGLPKTATTTLQNSVFARADHVRYLGKVGNCYDDDLVRDLVLRVQAQDSLHYDCSAAAARLDAVRSQHDRVGERRPLLLSDEGFSTEGRADRRLIAERLHRLFAPAKVLIVLRAQPDLATSFYLHYLKASGERPISFDDWLAMTYGEPLRAGTIRVGFDYDALVRTYEDVFGAANVIVLAFEMIHHGSAFAETVGAFARVPAEHVRAGYTLSRDNERMSERHRLALRVQALLPLGCNLALAGRRMLPQWLYQRLRSLATSGRRVAAPEMPAGWRQRIGAMCAASNDALARRKDLPLAAMGYPTESAGAGEQHRIFAETAA